VLVNDPKCGHILRVLLTFGGKTLQQLLEMAQFALKEAVISLGETQLLPKVSKTPFCPETCTFAPNLEQRNHWSVEKPPLELLAVNRFGEFQAL
jgi:hypothetical protein